MPVKPIVFILRILEKLHLRAVLVAHVGNRARAAERILRQQHGRAGGHRLVHGRLDVGHLVGDMRLGHHAPCAGRILLPVEVLDLVLFVVADPDLQAGHVGHSVHLLGHRNAGVHVSLFHDCFPFLEIRTALPERRSGCTCCRGSWRTRRRSRPRCRPSGSATCRPWEACARRRRPSTSPHGAT